MLRLAQWFLVVTLGVHAFLLAVGPGDGSWVESIWVPHVYPLAGAVLGRVAGLVPFSLATLVLFSLALWALLHPVVHLVRWRRSAEGRLGRTLCRILLGQGAMAALLFHLFFFLWGYHYLRPPIERRLGLATAAGADLTETAAAIVQAANAAHVRVGAWDRAELDRLLDPALDRALRRLEGRALPFHGPLKEAWPRALLPALGTLGVISPWTLEAHVDWRLPPVWVAFTAAHEKAHLAGFAPEGDASFVAWLALTGSADARLRYAGHLGVLDHLPAAARAAARLSAAVRNDLAALRRYRRRTVSPAIARQGRRIYDVYLKANRVAAGIADYGRVARLIHAWRERAGRQRGGTGS